MFLDGQKYDLFSVEDVLWLLTTSVKVAIYDFPFEHFFSCKHPWQRPAQITAVARIGAHTNYAQLYSALQTEGISLVHTPEEQQRCTELPFWYPLLNDLTPKSIWFSEKPTVQQIIQEFQFPIFLKGARQTSKHKKSLSIIENPEMLSTALAEYERDPVLRWQPIVCREYVKLRPVPDEHSDKIPASFEFRTFWWKGQLVGAGRYWFEAPAYSWTETEEREALKVAQQAANLVSVPFLVVDIAQRMDGKWIVIEVNDGQESGYAGVSPFQLWRNILHIEQHSVG